MRPTRDRHAEFETFTFAAVRESEKIMQDMLEKRKQQSKKNEGEWVRMLVAAVQLVVLLVGTLKAIEYINGAF